MPGDPPPPFDSRRPDRPDTLTVLTRGHWNPIVRPDGFVHLGGWAFHETLSTNQPAIVRTIALAGRNNEPGRLTSGALAPADQGEGFGLEAGGVWRRGWALAEWGERRFDYATAPSIQFDATSLSAGLFLFGAKPSFSQKTGSWTKTRVASPVTDGGPGAVELLMRWEDVDLGVPTVGGDGGAFTLGANWYLSDFSRLMLNVIRWNTENRSGSYLGEDKGTSIVARAQVSF